MRRHQSACLFVQIIAAIIARTRKHTFCHTEPGEGRGVPISPRNMSRYEPRNLCFRGTGTRRKGARLPSE